MRHFQGAGDKEISSKTLAERIRDERELTTGTFIDGSTGKRCLWAVLWDIKLGSDNQFHLEFYSTRSTFELRELGFTAGANGAFPGTPAERCAHFAEMMEEL